MQLLWGLKGKNSEKMDGFPLYAFLFWFFSRGKRGRLRVSSGLLRYPYINGRLLVSTWQTLVVLKLMP